MLELKIGAVSRMMSSWLLEVDNLAHMRLGLLRANSLMPDEVEEESNCF